MRDEYSDYTQWKQWRDFSALKPFEARYFRRELKGLLPLKGKRVLEMGFGNGGFLSFAKAEGAEVHGTELIPELLKEAGRRGFTVGRDKDYLGKKKFKGRFDLIVAFDVLEHLDKEELVEFFAGLNELLKPDGHFLARFPNGHSPFGRQYQNGDLTHKTAIGGRLIEHLAARSGFKVLAIRNPRIQFLDNPLLQAVQLLQRGLRNLVEMAVGYIYFNHRLPLDQNLVAHLIKRGAASR